jgi:hypothetical protein
LARPASTSTGPCAPMPSATLAPGGTARDASPAGWDGEAEGDVLVDGDALVDADALPDEEEDEVADVLVLTVGLGEVKAAASAGFANRREAEAAGVFTPTRLSASGPVLTMTSLTWAMPPAGYDVPCGGVWIATACSWMVPTDPPAPSIAGISPAVAACWPAAQPLSSIAHMARTPMPMRRLVAGCAFTSTPRKVPAQVANKNTDAVRTRARPAAATARQPSDRVARPRLGLAHACAMCLARCAELPYAAALFERTPGLSNVLRVTLEGVERGSNT